MKRYIAVIEIDDDEEIVGDANISYTYRSNGTNYGTDESVELKAEDKGQEMKTYEDGLNEAWEAARKIACPDGYRWRELGEIFGRHTIHSIFNYTASEVIDKIKHYEGIKVGEYEGFNVGDEVENISTSDRAIVVRTFQYMQQMDVMWKDGSVGSRWLTSKFKKTGRHFPQIEEVIKQMKESN